MKNHYATYFLLAMICMASCSTPDDTSVVDQLMAQNDSMQMRLQNKDSTILEFMQNLRQIDQNLSAIRAREMSVTLTKEIDSIDATERVALIDEHIRQIDRLLKYNRRKISQLNGLIKEAKAENEAVRKLMEEMRLELEGKIAQKEEAINSLKLAIQQKDELVLVLRSDIVQLMHRQDSIVDYYDTELNRGYYISGDFKKLQEKNIVDKEGGLFGLVGRVEKVQDDFPADLFQEIDIRTETEFPVSAKKIELITPHSEQSYRIEENGKQRFKFVISDPEKFWEKSKYLVMLTK